MKAARLHGPRDVRIEEVPDPLPPAPGDVIVRVAATGVCGTDLHAYREGGWGHPRRPGVPFVLGHECSGRIQAAPPGARDAAGSPIAPGVCVAVDPAIPCGGCDTCRRGWPHLCPDVRFMGVPPDDGSLREWIRVPARNCHTLPEAISLEEGALLEPLGVALHALGLGKVRPSAPLLILGAGPIGLLVLQLAKRRGADPVFVSEPLPWRRRLAERMGGVPLDPERENAVSAILRATRSVGVECAIEAAWAGPAAEQAASCAAPGGRIVLAGIPPSDTLTLCHSLARRKGLTFLFSRRMNDTYGEAIRMAAAGEVDLAGLISHRFQLTEAAEAFRLNEAYADGAVKIIVGDGNAAPAPGGNIR